jgi:hypothetical protein
MRGGTERAKQNEEAQSQGNFFSVIYNNVDKQTLSIAPTLTESDQYEDPAERRQ